MNVEKNRQVNVNMEEDTTYVNEVVINEQEKITIVDQT